MFSWAASPWNFGPSLASACTCLIHHNRCRSISSVVNGPSCLCSRFVRLLVMNLFIQALIRRVFFKEFFSRRFPRISSSTLSLAMFRTARVAFDSLWESGEGLTTRVVANDYDPTAKLARVTRAPLIAPLYYRDPLDCLPWVHNATRFRQPLGSLLRDSPRIAYIRLLL